MNNKMVKAILWQTFCLVYSILLGRIWFREWSVSVFSIFLCVSLVPIFYVYDKVWRIKE